MNHIIAIRPNQPIKLITKRDNPAAAKSVAIGLNLLSEEQRQNAIFKAIPSGFAYCNLCGKCDNWDSPEGCKSYVSPQDWACTLQPTALVAE
ncbi:hypothetical protein [Rheinheimera sp.]|uniref:hypothetical protein n=1 Tax=Rheinheimera sp. TaxID=1869214 RepID=UPI00307EC81F